MNVIGYVIEHYQHDSESNQSTRKGRNLADPTDTGENIPVRTEEEWKDVFLKYFRP